jgi:hypothetical protein
MRLRPARRLLVLLALVSCAQMADASIPDPVCRLIAGGVASAAAKSVLAPFERVKLILQTSHKYSGPLEALRRIPKEEGVFSLWRGNLANLARIVPTYSMRFALLDNCRALVRGSSPLGVPLSLAQELCAGAMAGAAVSLVTHPLDLARTQLAVTTTAGTAGGVIGVLSELRRKHGWSGPYRGLLISLLEIAPYTAISLGGFEFLKGAMGGPAAHPRSRLAASWFAGLCASLLCYPLDSVKRRLMVDAAHGGVKYKGSISRCVRTVLATEGLRGLYRGCLLNGLKSAPTFAATATLNDYLRASIGCGGRR